MLNRLSEIYQRSPTLSAFIAAGKTAGHVPAKLADDQNNTYLTAAFAYFECERAVKTADIALAMNLEAIRGETGAFDPRLHDIARPFPGQIASAANVRVITDGSKATTQEGRYAFGYDTHPRVQDAICVRAAPQTHGGVRDFLRWFGTCLEDTECTLPLIEYAAAGLLTALADLAHISERRAFRLNDTRLSYGLPMNLVPDHAGINHGFPVVQSNQAAFVAELKLLTLPAAAVKRGNEELADYSVFKILKALPLLRKTMAIEVLMCAQALDIVHARIPEFNFGKGTETAWKLVRRTVPPLTENRFVSPMMCESERLIENGALLQAVEETVGSLQ